MKRYYEVIFASMLLLVLLFISGCNNENKDITYCNPAENTCIDDLIEEYKDYSSILSDIRNELICLQTEVCIYKDKATDEIVFEWYEYSFEDQIRGNETLMKEIEQVLDLPYMEGLGCSIYPSDCSDNIKYYVWYSLDTVKSGYLSGIEYGEDIFYDEKVLIKDNWYYVETIGE